MVISLQDVTKNYVVRKPVGRLGWLRAASVVNAVRGATLSISSGESTAIVGPNGAGKTTLIKMMTGVLFPSSGRVRCLGMDPVVNRMRYTQRIGVVMGQRCSLITDLPLQRSFEFLRSVYDLRDKVSARRLAELSEKMGIADLMHMEVRKLSLGQRVRAELVAALMHGPELLFLDEPTIGLDLEARDAIHEVLRSLRSERGVTIVLTSHNTRDIEEVCDRLVILNLGVTVYDGRLGDFLQEAVTTREIIFEILDGDMVSALQRHFGAALEIEASEGKLVGHVSVSNDQANRHLQFLLSAGDKRVGQVHVERPSLEEAIKAFYRATGRETPP